MAVGFAIFQCCTSPSVRAIIYSTASNWQTFIAGRVYVIQQGVGEACFTCLEYVPAGGTPSYTYSYQVKSTATFVADYLSCAACAADGGDTAACTNMLDPIPTPTPTITATRTTTLTPTISLSPTLTRTPTVSITSTPTPTFIYRYLEPCCEPGVWYRIIGGWNIGVSSGTYYITGNVGLDNGCYNLSLIDPGEYLDDVIINGTVKMLEVV
jgi:hypothetical protein